MKKIGTVYGEKSMFLRSHVGEIKMNGHTYELSIEAKTSCPIIFNEKQKLWFVLSWKDIFNLAKEAGI